jgi:hypothetical protein
MNPPVDTIGPLIVAIIAVNAVAFIAAGVEKPIAPGADGSNEPLKTVL